MGGGGAPLVVTSERDKPKKAKAEPDVKTPPVVAQSHQTSTAVPMGCLCCAANLVCRFHALLADPVHPLFESDEAELRWAVSNGDKALILKILERNAKPAKMAELHRTYGASLVDDVRKKLSGPQWARARVYLGALVPFDVRVETHDKESIVRDIEALSDADALAIFGTPPSGGVSWVPGLSMFDRVKANLHGRWFGTDNDAYYTVLGLLIEKAERGLTAHRKTDQLRELFKSLFGIDVPDPYQVDEEGLDPVARARVDLAVSRIVYIAGTSYNTRLGPAAVNVALAGLKPNELNAVSEGVSRETRGTLIIGGRDVPSVSGDARGIREAIEAEGKEAAAHGRPVDDAGVAAALARAAEMIRDARARRDVLLAKQRERQAAIEAGEEVPDEPFNVNDPFPLESAQDHLRFLTETFFKGPLSAEYKRALKGSSESYAEGLRAMGADGVTVGIALMEDAWWWNPYTVIERLKKIAPADRLDVMVKSGMLAKLARAPMSTNLRDLVRAYIWEGRTGEDAKLLLPDPIAPDQPRQAAEVPPGFEQFAETPAGAVPGRTPKSIIALNDVLDAMDKGPKSAAWVLARLHALTKDERTALFAEPRFKEKLEALPEGDEKSEKRDFKDALRKAAKGDVEGAILHYPGPAGPWQSVALEEVRVRAEKVGHAKLRRAFVLQQRIAEDPAAEAKLSPADRYLIEQLKGIRLLNPLFDTEEQRHMLDEISFGQPQLIDTPEAALDPNVEAEYMRGRLRAAAGLKPGQRLSEWSHKEANSVIEAFTAFELLYEQQRPGGFSKDALPALAEVYYRALDAHQKWKIERDRNRASASTAAMLVGMAVAAVVVTVASGGTLGPVAIGALASVSAGAASAATGVLLRHESSVGDVLRDFGTGAVEGALAVAGHALAAKIIARAARGMSAGRAAIEAGAGAASKATHGIGGNMVKTALEGAIGGAGGDLFQTAVDEATWDRGIAHAFAKMLVAIGRGAAIGGTLGGVFAGAAIGLPRLYKKAGVVARRISQWFEASRIGPEALERLSDEALEQLVRATKLMEEGNLKEAERVIQRIEGLAAGSKRALRAAARARVALSTVGDIGAADLAGTSLFPQVLDEGEFRKLAKLTGRERRDALILIENGEPRIVMREGAPPQALREEIVHLQQWNTDMAQRARMRNLSEETFKKETWEALPTARKLELHIDKLEVEADAQRRIIDQLSGRPEHDIAAARQITDADETLFHIEQKLEKLRVARTQGERAMKALNVDEVPRLYAAGEQTTHEVAGARALEGLDLTNADDVAKLRKAGYRVTTPTESRPGRIARDPKYKGKLPQLRVSPDGKTTERVTKVRASFEDELARAPGRWEAEERRLIKLKQELDAGTLSAEEATKARVDLDRGARFRAALQSRVHGTAHAMDAATAGLLMKWGPVVDELTSRFPNVSIDDLLAKISKVAKQAEVDEFRRMLRSRITQEVLGVADAEKRVESLLAMIKIQPDNASRGHLFGEFRQQLMKADPRGVMKPAGKKPAPFYEPGFKARRQPDDVIEAAAGGDVPAGTWLGEDKAGKGAFDIDQLVDLAKLWDPKLRGFKRAAKDTAAAYKGEIFFFSEKQWAINAREEIFGNQATRRLLDGDPPGVILMYLDPKTGGFTRYVDTAAATPTPKANL